MTGQEILAGLNRLLDNHLTIGGSIYQRPYKDDFCKYFLEAYRNNDFDVSAHPRLTGDAIHDYFAENICAQKNDYNDKKLRLLDNVLVMWNEWYYALDMVGAEV
jgi:hypothetical protein